MILGKLHLHPISETHQFRPTLTYLDILSRKNKRSRGAGSDSDSDDGPPPDPDDIAPVVPLKKEKKAAGEAKEVHVSARKSDEQSGLGGQGSLSTVRREILHIIRVEEEERWEDLAFCNVTVRRSNILSLGNSLTRFAFFFALRSLLNHLMPSSPFFQETTKSWSAARTLLLFSKISRTCIRQVKITNTI